MEEGDSDGARTQVACFPRGTFFVPQGSVYRTDTPCLFPQGKKNFPWGSAYRAGTPYLFPQGNFFRTDTTCLFPQGNLLCSPRGALTAQTHLACSPRGTFFPQGNLFCFLRVTFSARVHLFCPLRGALTRACPPVPLGEAFPLLILPQVNFFRTGTPRLFPPGELFVYSLGERVHLAYSRGSNYRDWPSHCDRKFPNPSLAHFYSPIVRESSNSRTPADTES